MYAYVQVNEIWNHLVMFFSYLNSLCIIYSICYTLQWVKFSAMVTCALPIWLICPNQAPVSEVKM